MAKLEGQLLRSTGGPLPLWIHDLVVGQEITLAQVAGLDDGRGGIVTLGVAEKDVPEIDFKNVSGHGYHALMKWDGEVLHVSRRVKPKRTTNGFLTAKGQPAPDELKLKPGDSFRIARFLFTVLDLNDSLPQSFPYQTAPAKTEDIVKPAAPKAAPPLPFGDTDRSEPDLNVSVAPEQLVPFQARGSRSSVKAALTRKPGADGGPSALALEEAEVLRTPLVDSDNVINGLLEIVDRFDPTRSTEALDDLFRQAVRRAVALESAAADVIVIPMKGDPTPRGKDRLPWFSRTFVRDAVKKVGQNGGVLAGFWKADAMAKTGEFAATGSRFGSGGVVPDSKESATSGVMKLPHNATASIPGWAVCAPVPPRGANEDQLALYVSAPMPDTGMGSDLGSDPGIAQAQKVVLLFAKLYAALEKMSRVNARYQEAVGYLPRPVQRLLNRTDYDAQLAPRTLDVTVLFCDLRGSCGVAESGNADLQAQWNGVFQNALEQMSRAIDDNGGVIGGFIGDAVMGFWGWPDPTPTPIQVQRAARAALSIRQNFERLRQHRHSPLSNMRIGIGLTHGPALVGKLGNYDMKKIDVFGPTVNRASRIEGMTKKFGVEIIVDEAFAAGLPDPRIVDGRLRRLARVSPAGMDDAFGIYELMPSEMQDAFGLKEAIFATFDEALHEFEDGHDWERAKLVLERYRDRDGPSQFLHDLIGNRVAAPDDWLRDADRKCYVKLTDK
jgi:class 3 adenylate cyclase